MYNGVLIEWVYCFDGDGKYFDQALYNTHLCTSTVARGFRVIPTQFSMREPE